MTQHDPHTPTSSERSARGRYARMTVAAAATAAAIVAAAPAIAGAEPIEQAVAAPEPPTLTTAVNGNDLTITLTDPNTNKLTTCTAALLRVDKAIPLLPALETGTFPPLSDIDPSVFAWGPSLTTTNLTTRERTYQLDDVPTGIYVTLGICTNTGGVATDYASTFIGPTLGVGSAAIQLGSAVIDTPGALAALLGLLGIDAGSLGSVGSRGSSTGSLGSSVTPDSETGSLGSSTGSLGSSTGSLGSTTGSSNGSLGSSTGSFTGSVGSSTGSSTNSLGSTSDGVYIES